jgi:4-hydroxy-3-methylbut-2-enyl diphosphate reductase
MDDDDLDKIDYTRPVTLFSQTTKSTKGFYDIKEKIEKRLENSQADLREGEMATLNANDSICRQVSNREPKLKVFANEHDVILFVSGKKSSNGKALYQVCKNQNEDSFFIENEKEINTAWFEGKKTVGICGATSTPMWLMKEVKKFVENIKQESLLSC